MPNRRQFIQSGIALSAVSSGILSSVSASAAADSALLKLDRFVFDTRFAEAFAIAQRMETLGVKLSPFAGDLMDLWYGELDQSWKRAPMALGGVTTEDSLFILNTLAMDHQMSVVYRGEHSIVDDAQMVHKLAGPTAVINAIRQADMGLGWEAAMSDGLSKCPLGAPAMTESEIVTPVRGMHLRDVPLFSWIIAPRAAVASTINR